VEEIHYGLYEKSLAAVEGGKDLPETPVYVCPVCGNSGTGFKIHWVIRFGNSFGRRMKR